jgi:drug/metabolite transporter (DMT)-like permease
LSVLITDVFLLVPDVLIINYPDSGLTLRLPGAFVLAGLTGTTIARALTYTSIERIGAGRTEPLKSSQPLHATLIAVLVLGESVTPTHVPGIVLIVVGVAVVSWKMSRSSADDPIERASTSRPCR